MDEMRYIVQIQSQLEDYRRIVEALGNKKLDDYSIVVLQGGLVCESMVTLLLERRGYRVENGIVISEYSEKPMKLPPLSFFQEEGLYPEECRRFIGIINKYRNEAATIGASYEMVTEFSKALESYFVKGKNHTNSLLRDYCTN